VRRGSGVAQLRGGGWCRGLALKPALRPVNPCRGLAQQGRGGCPRRAWPPGRLRGGVGWRAVAGPWGVLGSAPLRRFRGAA